GPLDLDQGFQLGLNGLQTLASIRRSKHLLLPLGLGRKVYYARSVNGIGGVFWGAQVSKSPKGSSAVLAARISTHWLKSGSVAAKGDGAQKANTETALTNAESDQAKAQRGN
ncbi:hypothetical protein CYMTET_17900, partial [Cymbomonas tetramitiformis]